jgi:microsomal dipeptidase-like Zn-dependent dipeptidase
MSAPDQASALHERLFVIDTHSDTPTASLAREGWNFAARHDVAVDRSQIDLPRLREGGVDAAVFAVYVGQMGRSPLACRRPTIGRGDTLIVRMWCCSSTPTGALWRSRRTTRSASRRVVVTPFS